jgi:hypothetical protein
MGVEKTAEQLLAELPEDAQKKLIEIKDVVLVDCDNFINRKSCIYLDDKGKVKWKDIASQFDKKFEENIFIYIATYKTMKMAKNILEKVKNEM